MKNTIRAPKNGATKRTSPQVQSPGDKLAKARKHQDGKSEFAIPEGDAHPACLCVFDRAEQKPVCKIPLSEKEFQTLLESKMRPEFHGLKPAEIVASAIREKLSGRMPKAINALDELEMATLQANTLANLMVIKFDHLAHRDGSEFDGPHANYFCNGIEMLSNETQKRLANATAAFAKTFGFNQPEAVI
jgi:hypothetical protein